MGLGLLSPPFKINNFCPPSPWAAVKYRLLPATVNPFGFRIGSFLLPFKINGLSFFSLPSLGIDHSLNPPVPLFAAKYKEFRKAVSSLGNELPEAV